MSKSISRVLYSMIIYLGAMLPLRSCDLPLGETSSLFFTPYLVLLQMGFTEPHSRLCAGELLPHLSILTSCEAVYFCCTFLGVASTGYYPAPCSAELGLSSCRSTRSSDLLFVIIDEKSPFVKGDVGLAYPRCSGPSGLDGFAM